MLPIVVIDCVVMYLEFAAACLSAKINSADPVPMPADPISSEPLLVTTEVARRPPLYVNFQCISSHAEEQAKQQFGGHTRHGKPRW